MDALQTIKYNQDFFNAFCIANGIDNLDKAIDKAKIYYNKCLARKEKPVFKDRKQVKSPVTKRQLTYKQAEARKRVSDAMQTAKQDMIDHIRWQIAEKTYTYQEFMNDPAVYFDSRIMKQYYNNFIIRQSIIKYFENDFIPF